LERRFKKTEGIVLNSIKFGEGHKIINLFTKNFGKIEASAFGVRKTKSKFGSKLEPFNIINLFLYHKSDISIFTIRDADVLFPNAAIREKLSKIIIADALIEPVIRFVEKAQPDSGLYNLLLNSLITLNDIESEKSVYLLSMYDLRFFAIMGYNPQTKICVKCENKVNSKEMYMDSYYGFPICRYCKTGFSSNVLEGSVKFIEWALDSSVKYSVKVTMQKETLKNIRDLIEILYVHTFNRRLESWKQIII